MKFETCQLRAKRVVKSHPARGAWVEIPCHRHFVAVIVVAPRKGCVG